MLLECSSKLARHVTQLITSQATRNALFTVQEYPTLPNRVKLTVSRRRPPIPTLQNTVEMDTAHREPESLSYRTRVAYLCTKYGYFGFSTTGMALANRISDRTQCQFGCNRPTSYQPSSETGSTFGLGRNRQWYVVYISYFSGL